MQFGDTDEGLKVFAATCGRRMECSAVTDRLEKVELGCGIGGVTDQMHHAVELRSCDRACEGLAASHVDRDISPGSAGEIAQGLRPIGCSAAVHDEVCTECLQRFRVSVVPQHDGDTRATRLAKLKSGRRNRSAA